jgi:predicted RNase H-like nuclease (RuvC/YqgF family)
MMQRTSAKEQQVAKLEAEVMRLVGRNSELEANNELLESRLERADQQNKNKYQSQDATVNELQKAREGQNEALQILMKEKDALEQRLQREANETRKLEEKLDALEGQGEVLVGELNKTKRVRDELQAKVAGMEGTSKRAGVAAEQQMKEKEKRIIKLQDDLTAAGYEIKELKNK